MEPAPAPTAAKGTLAVIERVESSISKRPLVSIKEREQLLAAARVRGTALTDVLKELKRMVQQYREQRASLETASASLDSVSREWGWRSQFVVVVPLPGGVVVKW